MAAQGRDRGAAAVEFALVLPVLVLILFGIIDFGRMLNAKLVITTAAREGARAASLVDASEGVAQVAKASVDLRPAAQTVIVTDCAVAGTADATVTVTYSFAFATPLNVIVGLGDSDGTITLESTGVMPCLD